MFDFDAGTTENERKCLGPVFPSTDSRGLVSRGYRNSSKGKNKGPCQNSFVYQKGNVHLRGGGWPLPVSSTEEVLKSVLNRAPYGANKRDRKFLLSL